MNEYYRIWSSPTSATIRTPNNTNGSSSGHVLGQETVVEEALGNYIEKKNKTDSEIACNNSKLQSNRENIEMSLSTLDSTPVRAKMSDAQQQ